MPPSNGGWTLFCAQLSARHAGDVPMTVADSSLVRRAVRADTEDPRVRVACNLQYCN